MGASSIWNWVRGLLRITDVDPPMTPISARPMPLKRLWWLADAPLFLDEELVTSFYDAIVRPQFELQGKVVGEISEATRTLLTGGTGELELGLPSFLTTVLPEAKGRITGQIERTRQDRSEASEQYDLKPVRTAGRKLEELIAVYVADAQFHDRLLFMNCPTSGIETLTGLNVGLETFSQANNSFPRSLVFLEILPGTAIIPTFCEFTDGGTSPLYETLISKLWKEHEERPVYPKASGPTVASERRSYWNAIAQRFNSRTAMEVLESAVCEKRRLEWVDFRLRLNDEGETLHLHVCPRGTYPAGTFGYNFIRRGDREGIRIVGSLKRGPDLNVLAIFEC